MASQVNQAVAPSATKLVLQITGGSSSEPSNKKQKKEAQRRVQLVGVQDPSSSPNGLTYQSPSPRKTFSSSIIPTTMQWSYLVSSRISGPQRPSGHDIATDIIFEKAFRQMQESDDKIHDATHPLCIFGGRQIMVLDKITMPITFIYVHNTRIEQVVFDIVDMEYPYNAIIGRGTLNAFEAILHPVYLCMKIPSEQGPIVVHGSWTDSKAIHNINEAKAHQQYKHKREKAASADQPKPMLLCEDIAEQKVLLGSQLSNKQERTFLRFLFNNKDVFSWSANDLCGVNRDIIEHSLNVDPAFRPRK
jgi:hypothetical protein